MPKPKRISPQNSTQVPVPRTHRRKSADRRDEILNVASQLFIEFGPSRTTTRQIAREIGISQPSLYAHFPTKEALSHALATRAFGLLEARMAQTDTTQISPHATNSKHHLSTLIEGYIDFALEESAAYKIAFMIDLNLEQDQIVILQNLVGLRAFSIFQAKIEELQRADFIKSGPSDLIAQSIWAAMHGLCALLLARPRFPWADRAALIACHVDLIVQGAQSDA